MIANQEIRKLVKPRKFRKIWEIEKSRESIKITTFMEHTRSCPNNPNNFKIPLTTLEYPYLLSNNPTSLQKTLPTLRDLMYLVISFQCIELMQFEYSIAN